MPCLYSSTKCSSPSLPIRLLRISLGNVRKPTHQTRPRTHLGGPDSSISIPLPQELHNLLGAVDGMSRQANQVALTATLSAGERRGGESALTGDIIGARLAAAVLGAFVAPVNAQSRRRALPGRGKDRQRPVLAHVRRKQVVHAAVVHLRTEMKQRCCSGNPDRLQTSP